MTTRSSYYAAWNRTLRLQTPPYLARVGTNTSRRATEMHTTQGDIPLADAPNSNSNNNGGGAKKKEESLFGPHIGQVANGPEWTESVDGAEGEKLTQEVVQGWIAKSKEASRPTTTLRALVNLKRPTIRLSPISHSSPPPSPSQEHHEHEHHHHLHGLEFEFDCDAPKCLITMHVLLPPSHPDAMSHISEEKLETNAKGLVRVKVFEAVKEGGFGQALRLDSGAALELGRFEASPAALPTSSSTAQEDTSTSTPSADPNHSGEARRKRAFTALLSRGRRPPHHAASHSVTGPALAVVDASSPPSAPPNKPTPAAAKTANSAEEDEGVKVLIRLTALDGEGEPPLGVRNEQGTWLHVVRFGHPIPISNSTTTEAEAEEGEDKRGWVVKVVKREATIGKHTFHLHEIYGLSSRSSHAVPPAPTLSDHVYPPQQQHQQEEDSTSECLLCLSSPREVVLLPCRHLVACKPCALNMIEFGAGGQVVQPTEDSNAGTNTNATGEGASAGTGTAGDAAGVTAGGGGGAAAAPTRRKKKAKGWFCPVCRQPYTSLLRITTVPPSKEAASSGGDATLVSPANGKGKDADVDVDGDGSEDGVAAAAAAAGQGRGDFFGLRPAIIRAFSAVQGQGQGQGQGGGREADLERGEGAGPGVGEGSEGVVGSSEGETKSEERPAAAAGADPLGATSTVVEPSTTSTTAPTTAPAPELKKAPSSLSITETDARSFMTASAGGGGAGGEGGGGAAPRTPTVESVMSRESFETATAHGAEGSDGEGSVERV